MEPQNNEQINELNNKSALHHVTPLSKYVAMALFIILPFLGGWIGYTYAPNIASERVVEVEKSVNSDIQTILQTDQVRQIKESDIVQQSTSSTEVQAKERTTVITERTGYSIEEYLCETAKNNFPHICYSLISNTDKSVVHANLTQLAANQNIISADSRIELSVLVYQSSNNQKFYFTTGVPESGACCDFVEFDAKTQKFISRDSWYSGISGSAFSDSGRFLATSKEEATKIIVTDLETGKIVFENKLSAGSLNGRSCSFYPNANEVDINFSTDETSIEYRIFSDEKSLNDSCDFELIEEKTVKLNVL